ncbi:hypothetical protein [Nocardia sp. NPDC057227]|uniref:hypothetical protein n=1 Tax=Nocardia sp. NPDC057227 TaxID=3346056 RepID=UPI00362AA18F
MTQVPRSIGDADSGPLVSTESDRGVASGRGAATGDGRGCVEAGAIDRIRASETPDRLALIRALAERWIATPNDYDEDTEQRITDGWELRTLLAATEPFDLDELPARTLRARQEADAARRGVPFDPADYDGFLTVIDDDRDEPTTEGEGHS